MEPGCQLSAAVRDAVEFAIDAIVLELNFLGRNIERKACRATPVSGGRVIALCRSGSKEVAICIGLLQSRLERARLQPRR